MADVVYLHVGAPHTGAGYVQDRLRANMASMAAHGVQYPIGSNPDLFRPALDLIDRPWGGQRDNVRGEWSALVSRVRRTPGAVVVSHELLAAARSEQVTRAVREMGDPEVHVVYTARDLGRQLPAEWQQLVRHRSERSYRNFLARIAAAERRDASVWFWQVQGLPDVLNRWGQGLPVERVHVVTVPRDGSPDGELWQRHCRALGLDPAWLPQDVPVAESVLGVDEAALLREVNRRLRPARLDPLAYRRLVDRVVALYAPRVRRPITLPPRLADWAEEIAGESIAWLEASGVDVVGSMDELVPERTPEEGWENPDRPHPRRLAHAALDLLVQVLAEPGEAAEATAEQPTVPLLGRAGRRLRGQ